MVNRTDELFPEIGSLPESAGSGGGIGGHHSPRMKSDTYLTPRFILDDLGPFDLDPCAAPDPVLWPTAKQHYVRAQDGLSQPWPESQRIWLNPPYGRFTPLWMARLAAHGCGTALIFARTETQMFRESVWPKASGILFLQGRLHFHHADGRRARYNSGGPSVLIAYGKADAERLASSDALDGHFMWL